MLSHQDHFDKKFNHASLTIRKNAIAYEKHET